MTEMHDNNFIDTDVKKIFFSLLLLLTSIEGAFATAMILQVN
jgi:hypothetical protein